MRLLFASNNRHKSFEMSALLAPHHLVLPQERGIPFEFEEIHDTFVANALGKALHLYHLTGEPTLADDSGLVVDALGGAPGVHTARYGSEQLDSVQRYLLLLKNLAGVPMERRNARFVCSLALVLSESRQFVIQESIEGFIAMTPYGEGGFGYDPVFIVAGTDRTMAQMSDSEKNHASHRGRAARRMLALIETLEKEERYYVC